MPSVRVIPRLDIKGPNVVKGIHMEGLRVVGSPADLARRYAADGADEILFIDIVASLYGRNSILSVVEEVAREVFVPLTVGGGIRSVDDAVAALRSGADKVAVNTAALERPELVTETSRALGSQAVVVSIEAKRIPGAGWEAFANNGRDRTGIDAIGWARRAEQLGAGELLITSVDNEGTRRGYDIDLVAAVADHVDIPVIACGGAGSPAHISELLAKTTVDAVCCASILHYGLHRLPEVKAALAGDGWEVRS